MCMHYVTKLFTLVYAFYEHNPEYIKRNLECTEVESHWGQWSMIDEN